MQQKYNPTNTIENGDRKYGRGTILVYYIDLWHQCRQTDWVPRYCVYYELRAY